MATIIKLICENCNNSFEVRKGKEKKTCSDKCKNELRYNNNKKHYYITKPCEFCGNEFISKIKENKKYCSYLCSGNAKKKKSKEIRICFECGKLFKERIKYKRKFCSETCRKIWQSKPDNIKKRINKSKEILINKYGVDSLFKLKSFQEIALKNRNAKYNNKWNIINNKVKKTKKEIYGNENYNNYNKICNTKQIKYKNKNYNNRIKFKKTINYKLINRLKDKNYELIKFINDDYLMIKHPDGHIFKIFRSLLIIRLNENRELSTKYLKHSPNISNYELEISKFLDKLKIKYETNNKKIIKPYELDFYIAKYNLGIEFNGLYWHSEYYKTPNYHLNKTELSEKKEIQLLHIFEDEWVNKQEIVKSILINKLKLTKIKIFGRKTKIIQINNKEYSEFLKINHMLGITKSSIKLGILYNDEIISVMGFKKKINNNYYLNRFCNKLNINVIGGADKLLKFFIKNYNPTKIITFADRRYSNGNLYEKLGFKFISYSKPNYWYCDFRNIVKYHRFNFRKDKININNDNKTEHEIMLENKLPRIYDSGLIKFELNIKNTV